jgi:hypothetical protein
MMNHLKNITAIIAGTVCCTTVNLSNTSALTPNIHSPNRGISVLAQSSDQTPPVQTPSQDNQEDTLKPVAHFNPQAPVRLKLINQTRKNLETGLSTGETRHIPAGQDITLGPLPLPINCFVYSSKSSRNPARQTILKYNVSVDNNNVVSVVISQYNGNDIEGDSAISLRRFGSVFIY